MEYNSDLIVIVLGDPGANRRTAAMHVRNTLASGGAVLVAADTHLDLNAFLPDAEDVEIVGAPVVDPNGANAHRRNADYPYAEPHARNKDDLSEEEKLFAGFERLATNSPSALRIGARPPYLARSVAKFPGAARYSVGNRFFPLAANDVFAAAGVGPKRDDPYRCLMMADPSVLSNDMLYSSADAEPTDNFAFAVRLVPWLKGPAERKLCLFIEDGEVQPRFDEFDFSQVQSPPPKLPPIPAPKLPDPMDRKFQEKASKAIAETVGRAEDSDSMRNGLAKDTRLYIALISALVVLLAIFASIILRLRIRGRILARNYQPIPVDPLRLGPDVPLGSFTHRRLEILRGNDFRAPFTEYVLLLFRERGLLEGYTGSRPPKIDVTGRNRRYLMESVRRLWDEIAGHSGKPLPYTKWKELEPVLAAVRSAADADLWRFVPSSATRTDSEGSA